MFTSHQIKRGLFIGFLAILSAFVLTGCVAPPPLKTKSIFISAEDLKEKKNIPEAVYYDKATDKLSVVLRTPQNKRLIAIYTMVNGKPVYFFETPPADEVLPPGYGKDFALLYALKEAATWRLFLRNVLSPNPAEILSLPFIHSFVVNFETTTPIVVTKENRDFKVIPSPTETPTVYGQVDNLSLVYGILTHRALKHDGSWVIVKEGKESEAYSFVSAPSVSESGDIGYVARDLDNNWFTVFNDRKTPLTKKYQEIGQVFTHDDGVFFSSLEKGISTWHISLDSRMLVENLPRPPEFIVAKNGEIVYIESEQDKATYVIDGDRSQEFSQIDQLIEDSEGRIYAKIKNQFALWQVVTGETKSDQYVWMSDMFVNEAGEVIFVGLTSYSNLEFFKFHNK